MRILVRGLTLAPAPSRVITTALKNIARSWVKTFYWLQQHARRTAYDRFRRFHRGRIYGHRRCESGSACGGERGRQRNVDGWHAPDQSPRRANNVRNCRRGGKTRLHGDSPRGPASSGVPRLRLGRFCTRLTVTVSLASHKCLGRVAALEDAQRASPKHGGTGIAHTRWATHGEPSVVNAHPHIINDRIAVVHNGIIENHTALREALAATGRECVSATDTEVVAHLIDAAVSRRRGSTASGAKCATSA